MSEANTYNYVFNYTDHLGNIRLRYGLDQNNVLKILEENNYYPFGLKHNNYNVDKKKYVDTILGVELRPCTTCPYQYKYNGKEFQDELNLNVTAMDFRQYDSAIGRFVTIDPETDETEQLDKSAYAFAWNNPVLYNDPDGRNPIKGLLKKLLKAFGDDGVKLVAKNSKGGLKPISRIHAEKLLKDGKTVMKTTDGSSNKAAKKIMKQASGDSKVVRHDGHELLNPQGKKTGKTGLDHFQKKSGDGSHVLYDNAKKGIAVGAAVTTNETSNQSQGREVAGKTIEVVKTMTDNVENIGTKVFGNNAVGQLINDMNPVNFGLSEIVKSADAVLNTD